MSIKKTLWQVASVIKRNVFVPKVTIQLSEINYGGILKDKKIIITGGDRGLGYAIAKKCISEGAKVLIAARNEEKLQAAVKELGEYCKYFIYDVTDVENSDMFIENALQIFGGNIDCMVFNAGISLHEKNILDVTIENFEKQFKTNLEGSYFLAQAFLKHVDFEACPVSKTLLFISSERGFQCDDIPYGLTKASINSLVRGLSRRFYSKGIRVNGIAPGITASDMTKVDAAGNLYVDRLVSKRYFVPEEIAEVAVFLLSNASNCISGEIIACDAGEYLSSYFG